MPKTVLVLLAVGCLISRPLNAHAEDGPTAEARLQAVEQRMAGAEAELKRAMGLQPSPPPSSDRMAALEVRMTGAEAQIVALSGLRPTPGAGQPADRLAALERRMSLIETLLRTITGYTPPSVPAPKPPDGALDPAREHAAYCRWKEAKAACAAWRKSREKAGLSLEEGKAVEDAVHSDEADPRLGYLYLTGLTRRETVEGVTWDVRFASRPKVLASFRVNFYETTDARVLRMTSRFYQDLLRGEHLLSFSSEEAWTSAEGSPVAVRVELCYAGHAVDVMAEGKAPSADWWKRDPVGSMTVVNPKRHIATDGLLVNEPGTTTFWIVDGLVEGWHLDTVRQTFRRLDNRPERPGLEGTDTLPDESKAPALRKPHAGYVPPVRGAKIPEPDPKKKK